MAENTAGEDLETFFLTRVSPKISPEPNSGCWLWTGSASRGYGTIHVPWAANRQQYSHRVVYQILKGKIPDGLVIDYLCRVLLCCNPDHLEPVTTKENNARGVGMAARNAARTHCVHGHLFDEPNTIYDTHGWRICRTCRLANDRKFRKKRQFAMNELLKSYVSSASKQGDSNGK